MYNDMALPGGGASLYSSGPPLALYDLIGQKGPPVSYAYSCDMSILGEEDEDEDKAIPTWRSTPSPLPPAPEDDEQKDTAHEPSITHEETARQRETIESQATLREPRPPPPQPANPEERPRPPITQRETFPQPSKRPSWQTIRYQTTPGRAHKAQLEAWVSAWSASVGELGDDVYCACADSVAASRDERGARSSSPAVAATLDDHDGTNNAAEKNKDLSSSAADPPQPRGRRQNTAGDNKRRSVSFVCHNCARQPSPAIIPDQELVFPPASGAGRVAFKCKVVWRRIVDRTVRRQQSPNTSGAGDSNNRAASTTPLAQPNDELGGVDNRFGGDGENDHDDDDDEVDLDRLSSREWGLGDEIAERQGRLRRAERLLRKGGGRKGVEGD